MSNVIQDLEQQQLRKIPRFEAGDRVRVHFQVVEGNRRRTQVFEGVVLKRQGTGARETFTVRKQSFGVGVERTFPVHSPKIERIEVSSRGDVRRAKLYYLRGRVGKRARVRERQYVAGEPEDMLLAPDADREATAEAAGALTDPAAPATDGDVEEATASAADAVEPDAEEASDTTQAGEEADPSAGPDEDDAGQEEADADEAES